MLKLQCQLARSLGTARSGDSTRGVVWHVFVHSSKRCLLPLLKCLACWVSASYDLACVELSLAGGGGGSDILIVERCCHSMMFDVRMSSFWTKFGPQSMCMRCNPMIFEVRNNFTWTFFGPCYFRVASGQTFFLLTSHRVDLFVFRGIKFVKQAERAERAERGERAKRAERATWPTGI